jgi:hypothetical protein
MVKFGYVSKYSLNFRVEILFACHSRHFVRMSKMQVMSKEGQQLEDRPIECSIYCGGGDFPQHRLHPNPQFWFEI